MSQTLVSVYTDSKYVQLGLQSIDQRRARAWKTSNRKPIKHKAMRQVLALLNTQVHCQRSWVKAHHLSQPNQRVDMLARGQASRIQAHPEIRRVLDTCYLDQAQYHSDKLF